jgi:hypothetical protein
MDIAAGKNTISVTTEIDNNLSVPYINHTKIVKPGLGLIGPEFTCTKYLLSYGFVCCSGLIMFNEKTKNIQMAHLEPIDQLYKRMRTQNLDPASDSALFIYGTRSERAYEIEAVLTAKNIAKTILGINTGSQPFGLKLTLSSGNVSLCDEDYELARLLP